MFVKDRRNCESFILPNLWRLRGILIWCVTLSLLGSITRAQRDTSSTISEVATNFAAGRVIVAVAKDAIIVATIENPIEAGTHPPTPIQMSSTRAGVLMGPVEWFSPSSQQQLARLDQELPRLRSIQITASAPHLQTGQGGDEAADIEVTGQGLFERLDGLAGELHGKLQIAPTATFAELIIADYLAGYGPEVWQLTYQIKQEEERQDYWHTRVLRPSYSQFWPPEKGQPRTLMEFDYPAEQTSVTLLQLIKQGDQRLAPISASDPRMAGVRTILLQGESNKAVSADLVPFLRSAIEAIAPPQSRKTMAKITQESGLAWIIAPPPEPTKPTLAKGNPSSNQERSADAPSLLTPHPTR